MKKRWTSIIILSLLVLCITACGKDSQKPDGKNEGQQKTERQEQGGQTTEKPEDTQAAGDSSDSSKSDTASGGKHHITIEIEKYGTIEAELDAEVAPITVENFIGLAKKQFYDGLTFHRIISGFMIQGGDPDGNGTGGSDQTIKGEFKSNGVENTLSHKRGVLSMARSSDPDSASSQFFIVHQDSNFLDEEYAAFGTVTKGMEVVDQICKETKVEDRDGTVLAENQPKIKKITVVD